MREMACLALLQVQHGACPALGSQWWRTFLFPEIP